MPHACPWPGKRPRGAGRDASVACNGICHTAAIGAASVDVHDRSLIPVDELDFSCRVGILRAVLRPDRAIDSPGHARCTSRWAMKLLALLFPLFTACTLDDRDPANPLEHLAEIPEPAPC